METNLEREELIFDAALALEDPSRRHAYLNEACGGNVALRSRMERLLATHERAEDFFVGCVAGMKPTLDEAEQKSISAVTPEIPDDHIGKRVGPYKLLQKIGEGGCGAVYMAEQEKPVRRRVALKIIKLGMDTKQVIARFEAERQALAMMDHPNIARVLDAGATETGRPFFVMELVHGVRITTFCDERNLDTHQRLDLFIQVCQAIQHAHQKGIIHRDIKPSNILVTQLDGKPVPKVIDFGIAKATEAPLTDKTLFTAYGHFVGTPAYMSPEQADMSGMDVDTRSDLYSLGVLLYELLTGKTPFDQRELLQSGLDEMRRTLREKEPHRPSTKLNTLPDTELTATALHRQVAPLNLKTQLSGDLDWIVMKALEKDRSRRYETANALAMDIQRHLNNEPVVARPPSRLYRFRKLVRRNRGVFIATGAVAVALIVGLGLATWSFIKERKARERAVAAEQEQARLRLASETREKTTLATVQVSRERFAEADELVKDVRFEQPTLEGAAVFRSLAEWHALRHRWAEAADRFATLDRINQLDGWNITSMDFLGRGATLLALGNTNAFNTFRAEALARFGQTANPIEAERLLKVSLLQPMSVAALAQLDQLAVVAAPKTLVPLTAQSPVNAGWRKNPSGSISAADGVTRAAVAPDTTPPAVLGAYSYDGLTVGVTFSEPMDSASIAERRRYNIVGATVTNVIPSSDAKAVTLRLASPLPEEFAVTVSGVRDAAQNEIAPASTMGGRMLTLRLQDFNTGQPLHLNYDGQSIVIISGGADIWENVDQFGFAYLAVSGDFDYRLRVHSVAPMLDKFTRVGLMARDSLTNPASRHVMAAVNAENSFQLLVRTAAGATTASLPPNPLPTAFGSNSWVRLQRVGTVFHGYASSDGMDWVQLYQFDSAMGAEGPFAEPTYLGIATLAHSAQATVTAVLSEFSPTPTVPVNVTIAFALLEYRRHDFVKAAEWARRCLAHPEYNAARIATARAILALSLYQLGDTASARTQLEQSRELIEKKFRTGLDLGGGAHGFWFDWIFARTLLSEAESVIASREHAAR
ncbi:MAG: protein kinase [Verrucomicrobiota bacterium]